MKLIHYSDKKIEILEDRKYKKNNVYNSKPNGLWISVEGEDAGYNWKEWCESEDFHIEYLKYPHEIFLNEDANILYIKTHEELISFTKKYLLRTRIWDEEFDTYQIDWDEVKKKYQGIIISPYQWDCRLSSKACWYYGWDCSSGCIWDLSCIKEFTSCNI